MSQDDEDYPRKNPEPLWITRLKYRIRKFICNEDIACGFFWGATFSALVAVITLMIKESYK